MNRSDFLKRLGIGVVAAPVVVEAMGEPVQTWGISSHVIPNRLNSDHEVWWVEEREPPYGVMSTSGYLPEPLGLSCVVMNKAYVPRGTDPHEWAKSKGLGLSEYRVVAIT